MCIERPILAGRGGKGMSRFLDELFEDLHKAKDTKEAREIWERFCKEYAKEGGGGIFLDTEAKRVRIVMQDWNTGNIFFDDDEDGFIFKAMESTFYKMVEGKR